MEFSRLEKMMKAVDFYKHYLFKGLTITLASMIIGAYSCSVNAAKTWIVNYPVETKQLLNGLSSVIEPAFSASGIEVKFQALPNARGLKVLSISESDGSLFRSIDDAEKYAEHYTLISPLLVILDFVVVESIKPELPDTIKSVLVTPRNTITLLQSHRSLGEFYYATSTESAIKLVTSRRYKQALLIKQVALPLIRIYGADLYYHDPPVAVTKVGLLLNNKHKKHFAKISRSLTESMEAINLR